MSFGLIDLPLISNHCWFCHCRRNDHTSFLSVSSGVSVWRCIILSADFASKGRKKATLVCVGGEWFASWRGSFRDAFILFFGGNRVEDGKRDEWDETAGERHRSNVTDRGCFLAACFAQKRVWECVCGQGLLTSSELFVSETTKKKSSRGCHRMGG